MEMLELLLVKRILSDTLLSSSSSESSDDEDILFLLSLPQKKIKKRDTTQNYVRDIVPLYSDIDFQSHFRLSKTVVEELILKLGDWISRPGGKPPLPIKDSVLLTLWTMANGESFTGISDRFNVCKSVAHRTFFKMCKALTANVDHFIKWPSNEEISQIIEDFNILHGKTSFPGIVGAVGATHIKIPEMEDKSYYSGNKEYSVILQAVCDNKMRFTDIFVGYPGSYPNSIVWTESPLEKHLDSGKISLPKRSYLVGDSTYPLKKYLLVPFKNNGELTKDQQMFNTRLSRSRECIENAFINLMTIFKKVRNIQSRSVAYVKDIIIVACILHNINLNQENPYLCSIDLEDDAIEPADLNSCDLSDPGAELLREEITGILKKQ